MNQRLYRKIALRLVKIEKMIAQTSCLMAEMDAGLSIDLSHIGDEVLNVYEVLDERKDRGEYHP